MSESKAKAHGLHHVALRTAKFDHSLAFYCNVLGFRTKLMWNMGDEEHPKRAAMLDAGDGNYVEMFERDEDEADPPAAEARWLHLCLRCRDVDATIARVKEAGCTVTVEPKDVELTNAAQGIETAHIRLAFFTGPDGEVLELIDCPEL